MASRRSVFRLLTLPGIGLGSGLQRAWQAGYGFAELRSDLLAGLTVGTIAVPVAMALAIATGVAPQHGLYTAIVAGAIIALTGGSRFNVSGPTAAFVVILFPIVQQYGLGGLLLATVMAGMILLAMGLSRMGRLVQFVPYPVVLGFTAGIAVVIATMQLPNFLGLQLGELSEHFTSNVGRVAAALPGFQTSELVIGLITLGVLLSWPRLHLPVPTPLMGLLAGTLAAYAANHWPGGSLQIETVASRFSWQAGELSGMGIPPIAPAFMVPWELPGPNGEPLPLSYELIRDLLGPAFAIAMLGAIEALLCSVVADGLSQTRHEPNAELVGQGLGNIVAPFFGGITASAAISRTATSIRSGGVSPLAALTHSAVVLLSVVVFARVLGLLPMASLAALLLVTAWNMSEVRHFLITIRSAPAGDVVILLLCFGLTVLVDMVLAVAVGVGLAAALFIRRMALLTESHRIDPHRNPVTDSLPDNVAVYDVNGPLFFGAAEKALTSLRLVDRDIKVVILDMYDVPSVDGTAIVSLKSLVEQMNRKGVSLILTGLAPRIIVQLRRAGIRKTAGMLTYCDDLEQAVSTAARWQRAADGAAATAQ